MHDVNHVYFPKGEKLKQYPYHFPNTNQINLIQPPTITHKNSMPGKVYSPAASSRSVWELARHCQDSPSFPSQETKIQSGVDAKHNTAAEISQKNYLAPILSFDHPKCLMVLTHHWRKKLNNMTRPKTNHTISAFVSSASSWRLIANSVLNSSAT